MHQLTKLSETALAIGATRVHGVSKVEMKTAWYVQCACGWSEKAYNKDMAIARFDRHVK